MPGMSVLAAKPFRSNLGFILFECFSVFNKRSSTIVKGLRIQKRGFPSKRPRELRECWRRRAMRHLLITKALRRQAPLLQQDHTIRALQANHRDRSDRQ
jgi:hypothetical protein